MSKKTAFITGATAGIGQATARVLATDYRLILCGRRNDRLQEMKNELSEVTEVNTLSFDIRDRKAVDAAIESLSLEWRTVDVLINNAGNAHGLDPIYEGNVDDWDAMIDINVKGLLYVTERISKWMVERKRGHIVNIGSTAGKEVYPRGNVYCASKFAVDALTTGMRLDLNPFGIKVTQVCPGLVNTEFSTVRFKGDKDKANSVYNGMTPLSALDVAEVISFCLSRPSHVNIADIVLMPTDQASSVVVRRENS